MNRDPRTQPQVGDVVTSGVHTYYVTDVRDGTVFYTQDHPPVDVDEVSIDEWRRSSANDRVLSISGVPVT